MDGLNLAVLAERLAQVAPPALASGSRLRIPALPDPFVAPTLTPHPETRASDPSTAEVILVSSPAAVGKTTAASYLAAHGSLPVLDLAAIHVSTNTLAGLLTQDFVDPGAARAAFHQGKLR
jgi:hypothetical protein